MKLTPSFARRSLASIAVALGAAAPMAAAAQDAAPNGIITYMPEDPQLRALYEQYGFAEAVVHGDTIYISGIIAGPAGEGESEEDAYVRAFDGIGKVLQRVGSSWDDVLDITSFHVDLAASGETIVAVKTRYLTAPFQAWTAIGIDQLFIPGGLVEIKIVARLKQ